MSRIETDERYSSRPTLSNPRKVSRKKKVTNHAFPTIFILICNLIHSCGLVGLVY